MSAAPPGVECVSASSRRASRSSSPVPSWRPSWPAPSWRSSSSRAPSWRRPSSWCASRAPSSRSSWPPGLLGRRLLRRGALRGCLLRDLLGGRLPRRRLLRRCPLRGCLLRGLLGRGLLRGSLLRRRLLGGRLLRRCGLLDRLLGRLLRRRRRLLRLRRRCRRERQLRQRLGAGHDALEVGARGELRDGRLLGLDPLAGLGVADPASLTHTLLERAEACDADLLAPGHLARDRVQYGFQRVLRLLAVPLESRGERVDEL